MRNFNTILYESFLPSLLPRVFLLLRLRQEMVTITPKGYQFRNQKLPSPHALIEWFKAHYNDQYVKKNIHKCIDVRMCMFIPVAFIHLCLVMLVHLSFGYALSHQITLGTSTLWYYHATVDPLLIKVRRKGMLDGLP